MRNKIIEHVLSVLSVGLLFVAALWSFTSRQAEARSTRDAALSPYVSLDSVDLSSAFHRELFRESVADFYPGEPGKADSLLGVIDTYRADRLTSLEYKSDVARSITSRDFLRLANMYLSFIAVYLVSLLVMGTAGKRLGIYQFVGARQGNSLGSRLARAMAAPRGARWTGVIRLALLAAGTTLGAFVLLSPAYVVAYALKGRIDTASLLFMVLLAVLTNGVLVNYATRFAALLTSESRKGYVDTALVKNLSGEWAWNTRRGLPVRMLWRPATSAAGHIFHHIYLQARHQHLPAVKEHASFLVTGLIIIEMALNIQGHLGYELLQNILYRRYDVVVTILFGIFLLVKATELVIDWRVHAEARRYSNEA